MQDHFHAIQTFYSIINNCDKHYSIENPHNIKSGYYINVLFICNVAKYLCMK